MNGISEPRKQTAKVKVARPQFPRGIPRTLEENDYAELDAMFNWNGNGSRPEDYN
jgi:hypothetical protein